MHERNRALGPGAVFPGRVVVGRLLACAAAALLTASTTGCSVVVGAARAYYDTTPDAVHHREWGLREIMVGGAFDTALARVSTRKAAAPRDDLLRSLYDGLVSYYAGDYARSGLALRSANDLADERYTKSASRATLSMISNDLVLPYVPGHTERLLVPYYGALGYLKRGDLAGAAVEARLLSGLLEEFDAQRDPSDLSTRALLRYFAGAVFEAVGEQNDADVAYRNARNLVPTSIPPETPVPAGSGELIVVLERGFVPNRVEQALFIEIGEQEKDSIEHKVRHSPDDRSPFDHLLRQLDESSDRGVFWTSDSQRLRRHREHEGADYVLKVAWPVYQRPVRGASPLAVTATLIAEHPRKGKALPVPTAPIAVSGEISEGIIADYRRQRTLLLTRTIARAAVKYAAAEAAGKKGKGGKVLVGVAGSLLEHADTRSWHLLPSDISIARLTVPAGRHRLSVRTDAVTSAGSPGVIELGEIDVRDGEVSFLTTRLWPDLGGVAAVSSRN
jgi:hypothetical protein